MKIKMKLLVSSLLFLTILNCGMARNNILEKLDFYAPLTDTTQLFIDGSYRFITINGKTGFQPTSLHTKACVETGLLQEEKGTISFWFSPLEELDFFPNAGSRPTEDIHAFDYPFISDVFPPNQTDKMNFGMIWHNGDPQILVKFSPGGIWAKMDYMLPPFAFVEKLPMYAGSWYHMAVTWDKKAAEIEIFVNGVLMGFNHEATGFMPCNRKLYVGNTMMVMSELRLSGKILSQQELIDEYQQHRIRENEQADVEIARLTTPVFGPETDWKLDDSWGKAYECSFTKENDLDGWHFQTDESYLDSMITEITPEGLYFKTPDKIDNATRLTLWGPKTFEGDQWLEVDFRLETPRGLALVILCASGVAREDFIQDHELKMTGKMSPILGGTRNYHWEFIRRVNVIRTDMETQSVYKNPWGKHMYMGVNPKIEEGRWYKLKMIKIGNRIQGSLDNKIVFDVTDHPDQHNGPVLNFGRIGIRHMYHTGIRYRNLVVYERKP